MAESEKEISRLVEIPGIGRQSAEVIIGVCLITKARGTGLTPPPASGWGLNGLNGLNCNQLSIVNCQLSIVSRAIVC